jgi:hypothetical protein
MAMAHELALEARKIAYLICVLMFVRKNILKALSL